MLLVMFGLFNIQPATALTAKEVLGDMNADQRWGYVSGVVEGLATARWLRDKPESGGMTCIFDWYLSGPQEKRAMITAWFNRHPDKPVGTLLYVLIKKECGA